MGGDGGQAQGGEFVVDTLPDGAFFGVTGDDGGAGFAGGEGVLGLIEAEVGHAGVLVGPVAVVAGVGEDGADVALEVNGFAAQRGSGSQTKGQKKDSRHHRAAQIQRRIGLFLSRLQERVRGRVIRGGTGTGRVADGSGGSCPGGSGLLRWES